MPVGHVSCLLFVRQPVPVPTLNVSAIGSGCKSAEIPLQKGNFRELPLNFMTGSVKRTKTCGVSALSPGATDSRVRRNDSGVGMTAGPEFITSMYNKKSQIQNFLNSHGHDHAQITFVSFTFNETWPFFVNNVQDSIVIINDIQAFNEIFGIEGRLNRVSVI